VWLRGVGGSVSAGEGGSEGDGRGGEFDGFGGKILEREREREKDMLASRESGERRTEGKRTNEGFHQDDHDDLEQVDWEAQDARSNHRRRG